MTFTKIMFLLFVSIVGLLAVFDSKVKVSAVGGAAQPPPIVSISVCAPENNSKNDLEHGGCGAAFDTHQVVRAPGGSDTTAFNTVNARSASDEHSSAFSPGTLGHNPDYLFFVASGTVGHGGIGSVVLSGGSGPDPTGQWTFNLPTGYGSYKTSSGQTIFGQVFKSPFSEVNCPHVDSGNAADQDQTFDLNYAAPGSVVKDPTGPAGSLLMIYEGVNACVGSIGGPKPGTGSAYNDAYIYTGVARSLNYGRRWPTYRGIGNFSFVPLPGSGETYGPKAPDGALWPDVCVGNNCSLALAPTLPSDYGRYPVLSPHTPLATIMATSTPIGGSVGDSSPSAFVDDVNPANSPYLYSVYDYLPGPLRDPPLPGRYSDLRLARAQLNGGMGRLSFEKWYVDPQTNQGSFVANSGIGGVDSAIFPDGDFKNCGTTGQGRGQGSISYVEATHQYVLLFLCSSLGDPATGTGNKGAAWFYATSYDPSDPSHWSQPDPLGHLQPQEIEGSWSEFDYGQGNSYGCRSYKGWYPSAMSLDSEPGHLSTSGYVFYLWGCADDAGSSTAPARQFSSRAFKITTTDTTPPVTSAAVTGPSGLDGWYVGPTVIDLTATDDLSGVAKTEYSLDNGTTWTTGTSVTLRASAIYNIFYRSTDVDGNVETPKSITVDLDSIPPNTTVNTHVHDLGGVPINLEIDLTAYDNLSGVAKTEYRVDQSTTWRTGNILFLCGGNHTVHYFSTDVAGNTERRKSITLTTPVCGGP
jgi:hypothetical protein